MGGMALMAVVLVIIGGLGFAGTQSSIWAIGSLLIFLNFAYNISLGPICYTLIGEVSSTRLRQKSIVLSRVAYQIMNITCGIIVPRMLNPLAWNWGPKSGLFWAGSATLCTLYIALRLPETRYVHEQPSRSPLTHFSGDGVTVNWIYCLKTRFLLGDSVRPRLIVSAISMSSPPCYSRVYTEFALDKHSSVDDKHDVREDSIEKA